jgi:hypothetical protein
LLAFQPAVSLPGPDIPTKTPRLLHDSRAGGGVAFTA